jgi:hypothetical protein
MNSGDAYQIPVYTAEGIKITGVVNLNPSDIPSRAAIARSAIKVTFSKEIGAVKAAWYSGSPFFSTYSDDADAVISTTNAKEVFIYLDGASTSTQRLRFAVVSKADPGDTAGFNSSGEIDTSGATNQVNVDITKGYLKLKATNLYTNRSGINGGIPDADEKQFPLTSPITLEFAELPEGAGVTVKAALYKNQTMTAANLIKTTVTRAGKIITITHADPAQPLQYSTSYYLAVEVKENGVAVFDSRLSDCIASDNTVVTATGSSPNQLITFTTEEYLKLKATNIYAKQPGYDPVYGTPNAFNAQFPIGEKITLDFVSVPAGTTAEVKLYMTDSPGAATVPVTTTVTGLDTVNPAKLTITPARSLYYNQNYYLDVVLKKNGLLSFDPAENECRDTTIAAFNSRYISFRTETDTSEVTVLRDDNTETSPALRPSSGSFITPGTTYYLQFSGAVKPRDSSAAAGGIGISISNPYSVIENFEVSYEVVSGRPDLLAITVTANGDDAATN